MGGGVRQRQGGRVDPAFVPITIIADLASSLQSIHPLLIDGILHFAAGAQAGIGTESGWAGSRELAGMQLPLAQVHWHDRWWFAASQATLEGPETRRYLHRRPMLDAAERWTSAKSLNQSQGPDKAMRIPTFHRPGMQSIRWTAVGDPAAVALLLGYVHGIGDNTTHGSGWVRRWSVTRGGPPLGHYVGDVRLRHLPSDAARYGIEQARGVRLPLTPPYHERGRAVACVQVTR